MDDTTREALYLLDYEEWTIEDILEHIGVVNDRVHTRDQLIELLEKANGRFSH